MRFRVHRDGVLVIGYGNSLRGDDAAGPVAARRLAEHGFDALAVDQLTPEIAERVATAHVVYFVDADTTVPQGEIFMKALPASTGTPPVLQPFEHHGIPTGLMRLALVAYGAEPAAWVVGIGGRSFELGDDLSTAAERAVARAVEAVLQAVSLAEV